MKTTTEAEANETQAVPHWVQEGYVRCIETYSDHQRKEYSFGILDQKGREIGAKITTFTVTRIQTDCEDENRLSNPEDIGTHIAYRAQATRNGKSFGALQYENWCKTDEERKQKIEKYLEDAKKRALKKSTK